MENIFFNKQLLYTFLVLFGLASILAIILGIASFLKIRKNNKLHDCKNCGLCKKD